MAYSINQSINHLKKNRQMDVPDSWDILIQLSIELVPNILTTKTKMYKICIDLVI